LDRITSGRQSKRSVRSLSARYRLQLTDAGLTTGVTTPFQLADCGDLRFAPHLTTATVARTSRLNGASLRVNVTQPPGQANIHSVHVQLPASLPARQSTLRHACAAAQFASNPAGCPHTSQITDRGVRGIEEARCSRARPSFLWPHPCWAGPASPSSRA
jgi:hypothetical protein